MSGGQKRQIINTRERATSTDPNRMQSHIAFDNAERARFLFSLSTNQDQTGLEVFTSGVVSDPLEMHILGGIIVQPQNGQSYVHISRGTAWVVDPDGVTGSSNPAAANPDDNEFKYVSTLGVFDTSLEHPANAGPGVRIDVIECQRNDVVLETNSVDVFDPSTGQFSPVAVDKVAKSELVFRIRTGSPGGGFPGTAQGWCPIAVAAVPAGFSATDDIDYWDVRPLVYDRVFAPFNRTSSDPAFRRFDASINELVAGTTSELWGIIETSFGAYRAGGVINPSVPGATGAGRINLHSTDHHSSSLGALAADTIYYVWALFPFGLPRWAFYTTSGTRIPQPTNGILTVSDVGPAAAAHTVAASAIDLPAATALSGSTTAGACLLAFRTKVGAAEIAPHFATKGEVKFTQGSVVTGPASVNQTAQTERFALTIGTHYPRNARYIWVGFFTNWTGGTPGNDVLYSPRAFAIDPDDAVSADEDTEAVYIEQATGISTVVPSGGGITMSHFARIPVRTRGAVALGARIGVDWGVTLAGGMSRTGPAQCTIFGWEY